MLGCCPDIARSALYPVPMRVIVALLLFLCSANAFAIPRSSSPRGDADQPSLSAQEERSTGMPGTGYAGAIE